MVIVDRLLSCSCGCLTKPEIYSQLNIPICWSHYESLMAETISSSIIACLRYFNAFIEEIQQYSGHEKPEGLHVQTWKDELGRLRMWAANIGAHKTGQSSLDFRLRDSSHIRQQIMKLLAELPERLQDVRYGIEEGEDDEVESLEDSSSDNEATQTEIQQQRENVATIIDCLFQMSMLVRKPAQHDLRTGSTKIDVAAFEPFDYNHVRSKYPTADEQVVSRLGRANTRRRKYLKYRERHALKLKQGIDNGVIKQSGDGRSEVLSETIATDAQNRNVDFDDRASESGLSQTSYAPTLMGGGDITIPSPPRASHGGAPFECPYCYFVISVSSTRSWSRHVFNDLQPYICTEIECPTPDKLYSTRHEWLQHLRKTHHRDESSQTASKDHDSDRLRQCSLCWSVLRNTETYKRHMARHQQELALFVLPQNEEYSDEEEHQSDTTSDASPASSFRNQVDDDTERISIQDSETRGADVSEGVPESSALRRAETMPKDQQTSITASYPTSASSLESPKMALSSSFPEDSSSHDDWWAERNQRDEEETLKILNESKKGLRAKFEEELETKERYQGRNWQEMRLVKISKAKERYEAHRAQETADAGEAWPNELDTKRCYDAEQKVGERTSESKESVERALTETAHSKEYVDRTLEEGSTGSKDMKEIMDFTRRTYIRVHRKHMSTRTLDAYKLPWMWDDVSPIIPRLRYF